VSDLFAWWRQVGDETVVEFDAGIVAARFGREVASQAGYTADALNSAVAARERKAAAKALREAADMLDERASRARPGAAEMRYGIEQASEWLRARADQVEKGEA